MSREGQWRTIAVVALLAFFFSLGLNLGLLDFYIDVRDTGN